MTQDHSLISSWTLAFSVSSTKVRYHSIVVVQGLGFGETSPKLLKQSEMTILLNELVLFIIDSMQPQMNYFYPHLIQCSFKWTTLVLTPHLMWSHKWFPFTNYTTSNISKNIPNMSLWCRQFFSNGLKIVNRILLAQDNISNL